MDIGEVLKKLDPKPLEELGLLTDEEREEILEAWQERYGQNPLTPERRKMLEAVLRRAERAQYRWALINLALHRMRGEVEEVTGPIDISHEEVVETLKEIGRGIAPIIIDVLKDMAIDMIRSR